MVAAVGINGVSYRVFATARVVAQGISVPQFRALAAINFPSKKLQTTQASMQVGVRATAHSLNTTQALVEATVRQSSPVSVPQARILVAALGRVATPQVRAWTFSLDGHDFYVLRLGDTFTFVWDAYSEQWMDWQDASAPYWRANTGANWIGGMKLANTFGSNVVVGDDAFGLLWFLDPAQPYDEHPDSSNVDQQIYFERIVMGQVAMRGREVLPCYSVWLTADMGDPAYFGAGVKLEISDDAGVTFDDMGLVTVTLDESSPELAWYSLGQIEAPGRLFKITDDGAVARIDGMEMNDPDDK